MESTDGESQLNWINLDQGLSWGANRPGRRVEARGANEANN